MDLSADTAEDTADALARIEAALDRLGMAARRTATRASAQLAENARLRKAMGEALTDLDGLIARVEGQAAEEAAIKDGAVEDQA